MTRRTYANPVPPKMRRFFVYDGDPEMHDMTSTFEIHGKWWRSSETEKQSVSGVLRYTPLHGLELTLFEDFPNSPMFGHDGPIFGNSNTSIGRKSPISILDCFRTNLPNDPLGRKVHHDHVIYNVDAAIAGTHTTDGRKIRVKELNVSFDSLEYFAMYQGKPSEEIEPLGKFTTHKNLNVHRSVPRKLEIDLDRIYTHKQKANFILRSKKPIPFPEFIRIAGDIENFLTLCSRKGVSQRWIRATLPTGEVVAFYGHQSTKLVRTWPDDFCIKLLDMGKERFISALNEFFILLGEMGDVADVYFTEISRSNSVTDMRNFIFAACLESYHANIFARGQGRHTNSADLERIIDLIKPILTRECGSTGLSSAMLKSLKQSDNVFHKDRLQALLKSLQPKTRSMMVARWGLFLKVVKNSRNRIAHMNPKNSDRIFDGREFYLANIVLHAWMNILMLKRIGFKESFIRDRYIHSRFFFAGKFRFSRRHGRRASGLG